MTQNPVGWFEIYVQDMPRAKAFYEAVFKKTLCDATDSEMEYWVFPWLEKGAGASGALVKMAGASSGGNSTVVYFYCDDCAVEAKRVTENGGKIFREKFSIGEHGFIALACDTEGNMIGLHSEK